MKLSLSSDDKQIYKYQQNEQSPQIFEYKKNPGHMMYWRWRQAHGCCGIKSVYGIPLKNIYYMYHQK